MTKHLLSLARLAARIGRAADTLAQPRLADAADQALVRIGQISGAAGPQVGTGSGQQGGGASGQAMLGSAGQQMTPQQLATTISQMLAYLNQLQKQVQALSGGQGQTPPQQGHPGFDPLAVHTGYLDSTGMPMGQVNNVTVPDNNYDTHVNVDTGI